MRVLFVQDNGLNESLALCELSALLKAHGHHTELLLERETGNLIAAVGAANPDVILIPASILAESWVVRMTQRLKAAYPDIPLVLAGSLPSLARDALARTAADFALVGEAEGPMLGLLDVLAGRTDASTVPGLADRRCGATDVAPATPFPDLDLLPLPDRGLYFDRYPFMAQFPWKKMLAGRGCLYDCVFCYLPALQRRQPGGKGVRKKSVARVIAEAQALKQRYPVRHLHFSDDLFIANVRWVEAFAASWRTEVGVSYSINTTADFITEQTATLLAESGCRSVSIGIESANEGIRRQLLKKNVRDDAIRRAAKLIRDRGMQLVTFNMLAAPNDNLANALATLKFNAQVGADYARVTIASPLPGTEMAATAVGGRPLAAGAAALDPSVEPMLARQYRSLYYLFNWGVALPSLIPWIERLVRYFPAPALLAPANILRLLKEKQQFGLSWREGLAYFRHVGMPDKRTANFVGLVA